MGKFKSFVKGLAIGGGLALLFAPKPGKDLRRDIKRKAEDATDQTKAYGDDLMEKGSTVAENVKDTASDIGKDVKETVKENKENAKELAKDTADKVKETTDETMDELDDDHGHNNPIPKTQLDPTIPSTEPTDATDKTFPEG